MRPRFAVDLVGAKTQLIPETHFLEERHGTIRELNILLPERNCARDPQLAIGLDHRKPFAQFDFDGP
jgi:hypothetical protein